MANNRMMWTIVMVIGIAVLVVGIWAWFTLGQLFEEEIDTGSISPDVRLLYGPPLALMMFCGVMFVIVGYIKGLRGYKEKMKVEPPRPYG